MSDRPVTQIFLKRNNVLILEAEGGCAEGGRDCPTWLLGGPDHPPPPGPETTLNYWMMVERYPNLKEKVGNSLPSCEISSLLARKLVRWSTASCDLALVCRPSISKK